MDKFNKHDMVTDGTFEGVIAGKVSFEDGSHGYLIRFSSGRAVRFASELTMVRKYIEPAKSFAEECAEYLKINA